jgi:hypothetical protein
MDDVELNTRMDWIVGSAPALTTDLDPTGYARPIIRDCDRQDSFAVVAVLQRQLTQLTELSARLQLELAELRAEHTASRCGWADHGARIRSLEAARFAAGPVAPDASDLPPPEVVASISSAETGAKPNADVGGRTGKRRWGFSLSKAIRMLDDSNSACKWVLSESMWDACLFIGSKHGPGVGRLATIWSVIVFVLNTLIQ